MNKLLKTSRARKEITSRSGGSTRYNVGQEILRDVSLLFPSLIEQDKIAKIFFLIDKKIKNQQEKVEAFKDYKKGIMQNIFSQEIRFKKDNGEEYPEWKDGTIGNIVYPDLYPIERPDTAYWRLGIRSHGKGTFHEYVTNPSDVNMDTLYEVKKHSLIVNITFAWEHAIAITDEKDEGKLVSHRFPTYSFNNNAHFKFYKYYLLRPIFKYQLANASPGGAGRNRVLNKNQFLDIPVLIPSYEEQKQIAEFLTKLDQKLDKEQEKLDSLNQWKKGLLQQMFV